MAKILKFERPKCNDDPQDIEQESERIKRIRNSLAEIGKVMNDLKRFSETGD